MKRFKFFTIGILFVLISTLIFAQGCSFPILIIDPGTVAVHELWGKVKDKPITPGIHIINPLASLRTFSTKTLEMKQQIQAPARDQLTVTLEVSILYKFDGAKMPEIVRTVGNNHDIISTTILEPTFRSTVRDAASDYDAMSLYTTARDKYTASVYDKLTSLIGSRGVIIESILLRSVLPPQKVTTAIEDKIKAEQEAQQMKFVLQKEEQEAERKIIEAAGISDANKIIANGLTGNYIQWYRLETLQKFAASDNNTIIVIPEDLKSLPVIYNK